MTDRSRLRENILSLYAVQGLNYLLPLLVLPYLLRVLGPREYGTIVLAQSLMRYAVIFTDFGFNLSATRAVSLIRDRPDELSRVFWSTMAAKVALLLASVVVLVPILALVPALESQWQVSAVCGLLVLGSVLFPEWYFLGLERMRVVALVYLFTRLVALAAVFLLVHSETDLLTAAAILSGQQLVAAAISVAAIPRVAPLRFQRPGRSDVLAALRSSWHLFISSAAASLYVNSNAFLLGLLSGSYAVALYALANKIALALFNLMAPAIQAVYPKASLFFGESVEVGSRFVGRSLRIMLPVAAILSIAAWVSAPELVTILGGERYAAAIPLLRIMSVLPFALTIASVLAQVVMINLGLAKRLSRIYMVVGLLNLILLPVLVLRYGATGAALSLLAAELIGPILMVRAIRGTGILPLLVSTGRAAG